jgi:hypothetical protein
MTADVTVDVNHLHAKRIHLVDFSYIVIENVSIAIHTTSSVMHKRRFRDNIYLVDTLLMRRNRLPLLHDYILFSLIAIQNK